MKKNKIDVYQGVGKLKDATHIEITAVDDRPLVDGNAFTGVIESKNTIIATGARARSLPGVEVDGDAIITYRHALEMTQAPKSIVIIGAGPIGLEFGYVFRSYGAEVTIIEMLPNAAPLEDEEVSKELERHLRKMGIKMLTNTKVESLAKAGDGAEVKAGGQTFKADKALIGSVCRTAKTSFQDGGGEDGTRRDRGG
jgi:dihydrolipoamide dehydrogenase